MATDMEHLATTMWPEQLALLKAAAKQDGVTLEALVRVVLRDYANRRRDPINRERIRQTTPRPSAIEASEFLVRELMGKEANQHSYELAARTIEAAIRDANQGA